MIFHDRIIMGFFIASTFNISRLEQWTPTGQTYTFYLNWYGCIQGRSNDHGFSYMEDQLPKNRFVRCHKSFIININRVYELQYGEAVLTDGKVIPVSRSYLQTVQQAFFAKLADCWQINTMYSTNNEYNNIKAHRRVIKKRNVWLSRFL